MARKRKNNFPLRPLAAGLIILLALGFILGYIWKVLTTADYFRVREIVCSEAESFDLSYLKGRNIFALGLAGEAEAILRRCPDCSRVRLARIIPDRVYVEFIRRRPLALVKLYRYFLIDEDGVIFSAATRPETAGLPVITGLETRVFAPKPGARYQNRELSIALQILKEAAKAPLLKKYKIERVDIAGIDSITVRIPLDREQVVYAKWKAPEKKAFLEVKFAQGNIRNKVAIMAGLINQESRNLRNIKYIDLRFNEPVIKFKDVK